MSALLELGMAGVAEISSSEDRPALDRVGLHLLGATVVLACLAGWAHRRLVG